MSTDKPLPAIPGLLAYVRGRKPKSQSSSIYSQHSPTLEVSQQARQDIPPERPPRPAYGLYDDGDAFDSTTECIALRAQLQDLEAKNALLLKQIDDIRTENRCLRRAVGHNNGWQSAAEECQKTLKDIMGFVVLAVSENRKKLKEARADIEGA